MKHGRASAMMWASFLFDGAQNHVKMKDIVHRVVKYMYIIKRYFYYFKAFAPSDLFSWKRTREKSFKV